MGIRFVEAMSELCPILKRPVLIPDHVVSVVYLSVDVRPVFTPGEGQRGMQTSDSEGICR